MQEMAKTDLTPEERSQALEKVIQLCHANLFNGNNRVLKYLRDRGIYDATSRIFKLGAFPKDPNVLVRFVGKDILFKCKIIAFDKEANKIVSKFNTHELIIPIYDVHGNAIALMGRTLMSESSRMAKGLPKYTNTFFKKSKCLFGLNQTKDFIRKSGKVFLVEGNFDVITAFQHGMRNVAATSGTFLSGTQLAILARYTDDIRLLFDNDDAGQEAKNKIIKKYSFDDVKIKAGQLPKNCKDLDEYFQLRHKKS